MKSNPMGECEICGYEYGYIDMATLCQPIMGHMFLSPDPFHGYPPPFHPEQNWRYMECPMCEFRPFNHTDKIMVSGGSFIKVPPHAPIPDDLVCTKCGKQYSPMRSKWYEKHIEVCNG